MSFTQRITEATLQGGLTTSNFVDYTGGGRVSIDESIADGEVDLALIAALDVSALKSIYIVSDKVLTFETNGTQATETLTLAANVADGDTVTIDAKTYTFQTTLTNVDGNVLIGAAATDTIDNLIAAVTLGSGSGTTYAALTVVHPTCKAAVAAGDTMLATAKQAGTAGNSIATTEVGTQTSWGAGTMSGGVATDETINLTAGKPYVWTSDSYFTNLLATDITKVRVTNASGAAAAFKLEAVTDVTP